MSDGREAWVSFGGPAQLAGREPVPYGDWVTAPVLSYGSTMDPFQLKQRCSRWDGHGLVATAADAGRILRSADHWALPSAWRQTLADSLLTTA